MFPFGSGLFQVCVIFGLGRFGSVQAYLVQFVSFYFILNLDVILAKLRSVRFGSTRGLVHLVSGLCLGMGRIIQFKLALPGLGNGVRYTQLIIREPVNIRPLT